MGRCLLPDPPPADADVYYRLKIQRIDVEGRPAVKVWYGRAQKPAAHYRFKTEADCEAYIEQTKKNELASQGEKIRREKEKAARLAEQLERIQVGTLLAYSYGYDQTNVEFYQVTRRSGRRAYIRRIAAETIEGTEGGMCCLVRPVADAFYKNGEEIAKTIGPWGLSMGHGHARPTTVDKGHYCSWYA